MGVATIHRAISTWRPVCGHLRMGHWCFALQRWMLDETSLAVDLSRENLCGSFERLHDGEKLAHDFCVFGCLADNQIDSMVL